jgi:hypothetical protein
VEPFPPAPDEQEIAALLQRHRPMADPRWVAVTEERLMPRGARRFPRVAWRPAPALRLGAALAVGLAMALVALGLTGSSPIAADEPVVARDGCHEVRVVRSERVPGLVQGPGDRLGIVYETRRVPRVVQRCR